MSLANLVPHGGGPAWRWLEQPEAGFSWRSNWPRSCRADADTAINRGAAMPVDHAG